MKVRSFKGYRRPKEKIKRGRALFTLRGEEGKVPRRVLAGIAAVVALIVILRSLRAEPVLMSSAEIATVWDHGVLRVGVRTDVPKMGQEGEGLEVELAKLLAEKIMSADPAWSGTTPTELVEVSAMDVAAKLTDGTIDVAVCLMPRGANAEYAYSRAYYTDEIVFLTRPGEENTPIKYITLGCIQNASSTSLYVPSGAVYNALTAYVDAHPDDGLSTVDEDGTSTRNIVSYASYEDLFKALESGEVDAVAFSSLLAEKYADSYAFGISPVAAGAVEYAFACLAEQSAIASVADVMLADMEQDGSLTGLKIKYGLD
ncbi:MAG TPA: transporter substrate-binding domain-containing protein [Clostridia bacterium]|nr:transporter substrate-binding domain-containing protein [Clostridia bacterium]